MSKVIKEITSIEQNTDVAIFKGITDEDKEIVITMDVMILDLTGLDIIEYMIEKMGYEINFES